MSRHLLNFLSAFALGVLGLAAAQALGLGRFWALFLVGLGMGLAPRWSAKQPEPDPALVVDPTGEIAYLRVRPGPVERTDADVPQVNVDYDREGRLVGVEFVVWPTRDGQPAVPEKWPPHERYEDDDEGEEWKQ